MNKEKKHSLMHIDASRFRQKDREQEGARHKPVHAIYSLNSFCNPRPAQKGVSDPRGHHPDRIRGYTSTLAFGPAASPCRSVIS